MTINKACEYARSRLDANGLKNWSVRMNSNITSIGALGVCIHNDKVIVINTFSVELHPEEEVKNTINHEVAHAIVGPGHGHDIVWETKAREVGCTNTMPCSHLTLDDSLIDALRSGADIEFKVEQETIFKPTYTVKKLQDICPKCGKVAIEKKSWLIVNKNETSPDLKIIILECGHSLSKKIPKGTPFHTLKSSDGYTPYKFQIEGMRFAEQALAMHRGVLIADEMGLGKTIGGLGIIRFGRFKKVLIVTKSAIKYQWFKECYRWLGLDYLPQIVQTSKDYLIPQLKVYIVSYDIFTPKAKKGGKSSNGFDIQKLVDRGIDLMILDECQQIKNPDSIRTTMIRNIAKKTGCSVIGLSGTPWKNRGSELFTILNLLDPMKFPSYARFIREWVDKYYNGKYEKQAGIKRIPEFKEYTKDIIIRREVSEVLPDLPAVSRTMLYCELESYEQQTYNAAMGEFVEWYNSVLNGDEEINPFMQSQNILAKLARMRHIVALAKIPALISQTGKDGYLDQFLEDTERKITIFVHHRDVAEIVMDEIKRKYPEIPLFQIKSDMSAEERFQEAENFNKSPRAILVGSILASGEGINLQSCSDCVVLEREWNPANEDQAAPGRFRRIGQTRPVNVQFIIATETVDDILTSIVEPKRAWFHSAHNKGEMPVWNQGELAKEIAEGIVKQFESGKKMKALASK